jgi:hypothetical protein
MPLLKLLLKFVPEPLLKTDVDFFKFFVRSRSPAANSWTSAVGTCRLGRVSCFW